MEGAQELLNADIQLTYNLDELILLKLMFVVIASQDNKYRNQEVFSPAEMLYRDMPTILLAVFIYST